MPDRPKFAVTPQFPKGKGHVFLVGAGPGEPSAITLRAIECLQVADVVLYDYLVNPSLLNWANPSAELVSLGSHGKDAKRLVSQNEVNQRMVTEALAGKIVVRLKSGDPIVFARVAEEMEAIMSAGVSFEIVPGVTSALATGSYAGIPLTHRDHSSAVALITGHRATEKDGNSDGCPSHIDWRALANFPGTLVIYMGTTQVEYWSGELLEGGLDRDTPVAIVRRCGFYDQQVWRCRLDEVAARVNQPQKIRPPVIFVVGAVADQRLQSNWFPLRPLHQKNILVTRPIHQTDSMRVSLERLGANVLAWPAIETRMVDETTELDAAIQRLPEYHWIVFSSSNGVDFWMKRLFESGFDARQFAKVKIASIGKKTADRLASFSLTSDLVPQTFDADHLAEQLGLQAKGQRILLVRASRGREVLNEQLLQAGATVDQVIAYQSVDATEPSENLLTQLAAGEVDWVTVTSSAIARHVHQCFGASLANTRICSISPITSQTLRSFGLDVAAEAKEYTTEGMIQAICDAESER